MNLPLTIALVLLALPQLLRAGGEEVVVIYNSKWAESKAIAEYYAKLRGVPKSQVFGFDLPRSEQISRTNFQNALQNPLARKLESSKLWRMGTVEYKDTNGSLVRLEERVIESKIRYAVLCYGVPLKIQRDATLFEPEEMRLRPELRRNEAAVDSELACLPLSKTHPPLTGFRPNPAYTATNAALLHPTNGVLLVTRLDGPTPAVARQLVDRALQAEHDGLWGRAYIDLRNTTDPGLKQGDDWIRNAGEVCRHMGFETVVDQKGGLFPAGFPLSQIAFYAGWYSENLHGAFAAPSLEFQPGAFAYHLHSFSAASLRITNHNWVGPLLAKGVTATMGTVDEPYLGGTPDIGTFASRWLVLGMTFGEAACAAQSVLSWQTTVVGDPLYRAYAKPSRDMHVALEARKDPQVEWSHLRVVNLNLVQGTPLAQSVKYLEETPTTRTSAVLSEKAGDLYLAQGKPSSAVLSYEQALKLASSPLQRLRLRLALADRLPVLNREADALENYEKLLEENPAYPDKLVIYRKLAAVAAKLGKSKAAARYEAQVQALTPPPPK